MGSRDRQSCLFYYYTKLPPNFYAPALSAFEKAIEDNFDNSETFFPGGNVPGFQMNLASVGGEILLFWWTGVAFSFLGGKIGATAVEEFARKPSFTIR